MPFNLPIFLTWLRVATIPLVVGIFYLPEAYLTFPEKNLWATIFFIGAAVTDWLDGYLARKWGQVSAFGAFLDPVADKLMVAAALLVLLNFDRVEAWVALVIIGREITIVKATSSGTIAFSGTVDGGTPASLTTAGTALKILGGYNSSGTAAWVTRP